MDAGLTDISKPNGKNRIMPNLVTIKKFAELPKTPLSEDNIACEPVKSIKQVKQEIWYKVSDLNLKLSTGEDWYKYFYQARMDDVIHHQELENRYKAKFFCGQEIIRLYHAIDQAVLKQIEEEERQLANISPDEVLKMYRENIRLKAQVSALKKRVKHIDYAEMLKKEALKAKDEYRSRITCIDDRVRDAVLNELFMNSAVYSASAHDFTVCGIYFLIRGTEVVYVGQSVSVFQRIGTHISEGQKKFDSVRYIKVPKKELNEKELYFIRLLKPEYNGEYKNQPCGEIIELRI